MSRRVVITGAFSYTGAAVAAEMILRGWQVHTLTNRRPPSGTSISSSPLSFDPEYLRRELAGAGAFINTYWVRLPHGGQTFETAVSRSNILIDAAINAGVKRLVHVSVSNAHSGLNLGYYRGKAEIEDRLFTLPISNAIVRPTLVVGPSDVLTNNIAWLLRRFPFFPVPAGKSRLQPVTLQDLAMIIADATESQDNAEIDAAGPDAMTFSEYVRLVAKACHLRLPIFNVPGWMALAGLKCISPFLGDVILTREELLGLKQELLLSSEPPLGKQSVVKWLEDSGELLGRRYINDVNRHFGSGATEPVLDPAKPLWR